MVLFEIFLARGGDPAKLFTEEMLKSTQAQIMTHAQAAAVGFQGLPDPGGKAAVVVAVARRDARWVQSALEGSPHVDQYRVHEVDT